MLVSKSAIWQYPVTAVNIEFDHCLQHTAFDIITSTLHDVLRKSLIAENYNIIYNYFLWQHII